jgi:hypothetical protein
MHVLIVTTNNYYILYMYFSLLRYKYSYISGWLSKEKS